MKKLFIHWFHKIPSKKLFRFYFRHINRSNKGIIIALHRITKTASDSKGLNSFIEMSENKLEEIIIYLKKLQAKFITLDELQNCIQKDNISQPVVHISFDDGYLDNYKYAFPVLKKHNINFSIFVTSDFINNPHPFLWWYLLENIIENKIPVTFGKYDFEITTAKYITCRKEELFANFRQLLLKGADTDLSYFKEKLGHYIKDDLFLPKMLNWEQLTEMLNSGLCEIGVHTKTHARFANITSNEKINEIKICREEIKIHTGITSKYFAYPFGSMEDIGSVDSLKSIMEHCGIISAFTTMPFELNSTSGKYLLPRLFLNNSSTPYSLKTRLDGTYQRNFL